MDNPAEGQRLPEPPGRSRWLTLDEAARLIAAAAQERQAEHLVDFITLGLHTGMRSGELLGLDWRRVDWRQAVIRLDAGDQKNGKAGNVPLNQTAPVKPCSPAPGGGPRIVRPRPGCFATAPANASPVSKRALPPPSNGRESRTVTPHDLRRTCASWLVQAGTPIQEVARLLRHADIQTTLDVYAHLMPDQLRGTVERLDRHNLVIDQNPDEKKTALSR